MILPLMATFQRFTAAALRHFGGCYRHVCCAGRSPFRSALRRFRGLTDKQIMYFDHNYLPRGLAYRSLQQLAPGSSQSLIVYG